MVHRLDILGMGSRISGVVITTNDSGGHCRARGDGRGRTGGWVGLVWFGLVGRGVDTDQEDAAGLAARRNGRRHAPTAGQEVARYGADTAYDGDGDFIRQWRVPPSGGEKVQQGEDICALERDCARGAEVTDRCMCAR
jgi:hypothetical protein